MLKVVIIIQEKWKPIPGYEGYYEISNMGRIKSFHEKKEGRILSETNKKNWYFTVVLYRDDKDKNKTFRIHRLVAEQFIGKIPKGYHVHHKDGNKQNNVYTNLEIVHPSQHARKSMKINPNFVKAMNNRNMYIHPKHIRQFTLDGFFIAEYANGQIAENYTGVCQRNILQVANKTPYNKKGNIRTQAGGYKWEIVEEGR